LLAAWGLLLAASGLATAQVGPWPMLQQNPGHTGQSPLLGPLFSSVTPPPGAVKAWQGFDKIKMSPIVGDDGTIYVGLGFSFCAINGYPAMTTKWCTKLLADVSGSAALLAFNPHFGKVVVYAGDRDNSLTAFDKDTGAVLCLDPQPPAPQPCPRPFRYNFGREGDIWASPAPGPGGEIYFVHTQSFDGLGTFTALKPDGSVKWKYTIGQYVFGSGAPAIHPNGRIYLASKDGFLYCFIDKTGSAIPCPSPWPSTPPFIGNFPSAVMIGPTGHLYMGSSIGLAKIHPDTGQVLASVQTIGTAGMPALGPSGTIYLGSKSFKDKRLYAVKPDMTASWVFGPMFVEEDATPFPIVAADGVIYVGFGKGVYALTPDKTLLWSYQTGNQIISNPALAGNATPDADGTAILYQGSVDWKLHAISSVRSSSASNHVPVALAVDGTITGTVGQSLVFDGSPSTDEDQDALSYQWDFGDGASASGAVVTHPYSAPGPYDAVLTVSDGLLSSTYTVSVEITDAELVTCTDSFTDSFDRGDDLTMLGRPDGGACPPGSQWIPAVGTLFINGNKATSAAVKGTHVAVLPSMTGVNQTVEADFTSIQDNNPSPRFGVVLRYQDPQNYYLVSRLAGGTTGLRISRIFKGVETVLKHVPAPNPVPGTAFHLKGSVSGNVLTLALDGVSKASASDPNAAFGSGSVGVYLATGSNRSYVADNFAASAE
jgi:PKD repeat protein